MKRVVFLIVLALLVGGCRTRIGDLTAATSKNLPTQFDAIQTNVIGRDCAHIALLIIPLGTLNPTIDGAIDDALSQVAGADALVDVSIHTETLFTLIYNRQCVRVEGTAISTR